MSKAKTGWFGQSQRHSNARKYGKAGGRYKNQYVVFQAKNTNQAEKLYKRLNKHRIEAVIYDYPNTKVLVPTKDVTYKQLKKAGVRIPAKGDFDKDGVPNKKDCRPLNPKAQDNGIEITTTEPSIIEKAKSKYKQFTANLERERIEEKKRKAKRIERELETIESISEEDKERIADLDVKELTAKELKELAVIEGESFFGGNQYEDELKRRIKEEARLESELADTRKTVIAEKNKSKTIKEDTFIGWLTSK